MTIEVTPVETKRALASFIRLPRRLYASMAGYVPPLDLERRGLLHPKVAVLFKSGRVRYFLASSDGRIVGRISAQVDPAAIAQWGEPIGLFGALDAVDDAAVVAALLDAAAAWLRSQGMERARGPYLLSPNGESGLMISGQGARPMIMMPWHPQYLARHLEALGWSKAMDLLAYDLAIGAEAEAAHPVTAMRIGTGNLRIRAMRPRQMAEDAEILRRVYNDAWRSNWGFVPIAPAEMQAMVEEMKPLLKPSYYILVEREGEALAVALVVPNLFDIIADLGGAPTPGGWIRLAWRLLNGRFRSARVILLGVVPHLQGTALGGLLPSLVIKELMQRGRSLPFRTVELGWVLETNVRMRRLIERLSPLPSKRFRLYEKSLLADPWR